MSASLPSNDRGAENRRSTRIIYVVPVTIRGMDALGQAFEEFTSTVTVNCNGCKYESKHYVPKGSKLTIEIGKRGEGSRPRIMPARAVWVQRPRTYRETFHSALEFEVPGNVWEVKSPPHDWFPHPDDEELIIPVYTEAEEPEPVAVGVAVPLVQESEAAAHMSVTTHTVLAVSAPEPVALVHSESFAIPVSSQKNETKLEAARQMVRTTIEAAMTQEMALLRQRLESHLQESLQETARSLADQIARGVLKKVVEQETERTAAIVAEAHEACQANVEKLNAKIRLAMREVLDVQPATRKSTSKKPRRKSTQ